MAKSRSRFGTIHTPRVEIYSSFFNADITRNSPKGFPEECGGCPHIIFNKENKDNACVYIQVPKMRRFPCFFKENVPPGGFDGSYGKTVNNYIVLEKRSPKTTAMLAKKSTSDNYTETCSEVSVKDISNKPIVKLKAMPYGRIRNNIKLGIMTELTEEQAIKSDVPVYFGQLAPRGVVMKLYGVYISHVPANSNKFIPIKKKEFEDKLKTGLYIEISSVETSIPRVTPIYYYSVKNGRQDITRYTTMMDNTNQRRNNNE